MALTANGVSAAAVPDATVTADASTDPDGSAHLHLVVKDGTESGSPTTAATSPTTSAPAAVPLAWLTGPAGSRSLAVQITPGGDIRLCDPALVRAADPQGCA
ncbi:MAG: hypothetical protein J0H00_11430 [Burkholderiales bacterium]|nr:hypothetical protein [Burkholderiales bacterium]